MVRPPTKDVARPSAEPEPEAPSPPPVDDELTIEIKQLCSRSGGLASVDNMLSLSRIMVKADGLEHRLLILRTLEATDDVTCLRKFLRLQGLSLLWSWMVDIGDVGGNELATSIMDVLRHLPIPNKNVLDDSKVMAMVRKWSQLPAKPAAASTSRLLNNKHSSGENGCLATVGEASNSENLSETSDSSPRHEVSMANGISSPLSTPSPVDTPGKASPQDNKCNGSALSDDGVEDEELKKLRQEAASLLESWSNLKEVYRIPKKAPKPRTSPKRDRPESPTPTSSSSASQHDDRRPPFKRERGSPDSRYSSRNGRDSPQTRWTDPQKRSRHSSPLSDHTSRWKPRAPTANSNPSDFPALIQVPQTQSTTHHLPKSTISSLPSAIPSSTMFAPLTHPPIPPSPIVGGVAAFARPPIAASYPPQVFPPEVAAAVAAGIPPPPLIGRIQPMVMPLPGQIPLASLHAGGAVALTGRNIMAAGLIMPQQLSSGSLGEEAMVLGDGSSVEDYNNSQNEDGSETPEDNLPPQWRSALDKEGKVYYYHIVRRVSQWERPTIDDLGRSRRIPSCFFFFFFNVND